MHISSLLKALEWPAAEMLLWSLHGARVDVGAVAGEKEGRCQGVHGAGGPRAAPSPRRASGLFGTTPAIHSLHCQLYHAS